MSEWVALKDAVSLLETSEIKKLCLGASNHCKRDVIYRDGWFEIGGSAHTGELECSAVFKLNEDVETALFGSNPAAKIVVKDALAYLRTLLEKRIRRSVQDGTWLISAKIEAPHFESKPIAGDTLGQYVLDWKSGGAASHDGRHHLYFVQVARRTLIESDQSESTTGLTARDEARAIDVCAKMLKADESLTKSALSAHLKEVGIIVSGVGFKERVWRVAREKAGLSAAGKSGRRSRKSITP